MSINVSRWAHVTVATSATALFASSALAASATRKHILRHDESLWTVAGKYHVSVHDLRLMNHIQDVNDIPDGKMLIIPSRPQRLRLRTTMHRAEKVRGNGVSVRLGPAEYYQRIAFVDAGDPMIVTAERDGWAQESATWTANFGLS